MGRGQPERPGHRQLVALEQRRERLPTAVTAVLVGLEVDYSSITPGSRDSEEFEGITSIRSSAEDLEQLGEDVELTESYIVELLAGTLAEELLGVETLGDWHTDMAAVSELAMRISGGPSDTDDRIARLRLLADDVLVRNRIAVEQVAIALMERTNLTGDEIRDMIRARSVDGQSNS